jgi:anti-sigma B factor antagonist
MRAMAAQPFQVTQRTGANPTVQIISVTGAITVSSSPAFQDAIGAAAAALIIDMTEVPSVDSMAIGTLVRALVACNKTGGRLLLVGLNHRVKNILQITGVDSLFETYLTVPEAEAKLR